MRSPADPADLAGQQAFRVDGLELFDEDPDATSHDLDLGVNELVHEPGRGWRGDDGRQQQRVGLQDHLVPAAALFVSFGLAVRPGCNTNCDTDLAGSAPGSYQFGWP